MLSIKNYLKIGSLIAVILICSYAFAQNDYYYYGGGEKRYLTLSPDRVTVKFSSPMTQQDIYNFILSDDALNPLLGPYPIIHEFFILYVLPDNNIEALIQRFRSRQEIELANPVYLTSDSMPLMMTNRFVVQFYDWVSRSTIDGLNALHGAIIVDSLTQWVPNLFVLKLTGEIDKDVLGTANLYYEEPTTDYSHPEFLAEIIIEPYDYIPGDLDGDGSVALSDVVYLINYLFKSGPPLLQPFEIADFNCNGKVSVADVVYLISYLFKEGPKPIKCY